MEDVGADVAAGTRQVVRNSRNHFLNEVYWGDIGK